MPCWCALRDDRGHVRAGPAAPAGGVRAVRVLLAEVAVAIGADREVGDGREDVVVDLGRRAGQLPVGQEAEHLAAEARRRRRGRRCRRPGRRPRRRSRQWMARPANRPACGRRSTRGRRRPRAGRRAVAGAGAPLTSAQAAALRAPAISRRWPGPPAGPSAPGCRRASRRRLGLEPDGDAAARLEVIVVLVRHRLLVGDGRVLDGRLVGRGRPAAACRRARATVTAGLARSRVRRPGRVAVSGQGRARRDRRPGQDAAGEQQRERDGDRRACGEERGTGLGHGLPLRR